MFTSTSDSSGNFILISNGMIVEQHCFLVICTSSINFCFDYCVSHVLNQLYTFLTELKDCDWWKDRVELECWKSSNFIVKGYLQALGNCKHSFHMHCIVKWTETQNTPRPQCPLCRQEWVFATGWKCRFQSFCDHFWTFCNRLFLQNCIVLLPFSLWNLCY